MDPRVLAHFDGDLTRANLQPRKRDQLLARYPPPVVEEVAAVESVARRAHDPASAASRSTTGGGARGPLPRLRLHLRGRGRRRARGLRRRDRLGRRPRPLVLPRLRRAREGRLRARRSRAGREHRDATALLMIGAVTASRPDAHHERARRRRRRRAHLRGGLGQRHDGASSPTGSASAGRPSTTRSARSPRSPRRWSCASCDLPRRRWTGAFDEHPDDLVGAIRAAVTEVLVEAEGNPLLHAVVSPATARTPSCCRC